MRRTPGPVGKGCETCHVWYFGRPNQKHCRACAIKNKKASDYRTHKRPREYHDLTEAEIEATFTDALAQIRRERRYTGDVGSSHQWKYTEPGR